jgi:succinate-acetate transporter protein
MTPTLGNPGPLGLLAFSLTTILLSLVNAGVLPAGGEPVVIPLALAFGGIAQLIAGILEFKTGNSFGMTAFVAYGAFWIWFGLLLFFAGNHLIDLSKAGPTIGVALLLWGAMSFGLWLCTFRIHFALWLTFLLILPTFVCLGLGAMGNPNLTHLGGWGGLATGIVAGYTGLATLYNIVAGRDIAPLGKALISHARPGQDPTNA